MVAVLNQGLGYGIVLGFGLVFAGIMTLITMIQKRFLGEKITSEEYMAAGRNVKTGLVASAVVSSWTWAATLLQSSSVAYKYGISGPFWYASGASVQVLLFSVLAIELKRKCPNAHTFLEIISIRYGRKAHFVFLFFGLLTNIIVSAMLLLGGSAVVTALTGMNTIAACFLLPLGVIIYTLFGGLKATFVADYTHTVVIMFIVLLFSFTAYASSDLIGSPGRMYDLLHEAAERHPVSGNHAGSYLTMASSQGLMFGIINLCSNFGTVFIDNAYWQRAIAASPHSTVKAYLIGGLSWFAIPFTLATTLGIAAVALESNERFPTFPNRILPSDVSAGLVAPNAAVALLGTGGAVAVLLLVFMAVTSAASAELIAVSSVCTFDVYRAYINPMATGKQLIRVSHAVVAGFGIIMGVLAVILKEAGIDLGYLYSLMGVLISSAVLPVTFSLMWKKQNALAAIAGPIGGLCISIPAWLICAKLYSGEITIATTSTDQAMLAGNLAALISGGLISAIISWIKPDNYTFEGTRSLRQVTDDATPTPESNNSTEDISPKEEWSFDAEEDAKLARASRFARWSSGTMTVVLILLWPLPMFFSNYVFSRGFYTGWVILSIIWAICSTIAVTIYPIWESRGAIGEVFKGMYNFITEKQSTAVV
ncbi:urea transporter [Lobosporangium transversale]|uniref:Urea transporter n=1 Tax=Lobosporangium transversale TaxID=64571 RepID=A0A1Y2GTR6_9FUNG|nr:urea transporter [Lobosporangium transversale]ORZ17603.1 urea transporter [Lobosporangium transversale]|eukprot:XP_021881990.1 urea transporter [Lobosporangium transversale]